jgi:hypothetical protein
MIWIRSANEDPEFMMSEADKRLHAEASAAVVRIAKVLDVPLSAFDAAADQADAEAHEVLALFASLRPDARQRCLAYLREEARRSEMQPQS